MVKKLNEQDRAAIEAAVKEAETHTSTEIAVVVADKSDHYHGFTLLDGVIVGSIAALALWRYNSFLDFPLLLATQLGVAALFVLLARFVAPFLSHPPRKLAEHHAATAAARHFFSLQARVPHGVPVIVLYVSLLERRAHILHTRDITAKIPQTVWEEIISAFTVQAKRSVREACLAAVADMASKLQTPFPPKEGKRNYLGDGVVGS